MTILSTIACVRGLILDYYLINCTWSLALLPSQVYHNTYSHTCILTARTQCAYVKTCDFFSDTWLHFPSSQWQLQSYQVTFRHSSTDWQLHFVGFYLAFHLLFQIIPHVFHGTEVRSFCSSVKVFPDARTCCHARIWPSAPYSPISLTVEVLNV